MPRLLDRLVQWKRRYGDRDPAQLEQLLAALARHRFRDAADLAAVHETLLFLRAYPPTERTARLADEILFSFGDRITGDLDYFEDPEISGIAETSLTAVFSYEVAYSLAERHPRDIEIAWDRYDDQDRLGALLCRMLPFVAEDYPVEAHVPFSQWVARAHRRGSDLTWILAQLAPWSDRAILYNSLQLPLTWQIRNSPVSRSRLRLPVRSVFLHREPLIRRADVSLEKELQSPPLPVRRLSPREARRILDIIMNTSAMRYRELYGFSHPERSAVFHAPAGRGVDIYFFGVPPQARLPLRAYHGAMFFKNGVPAGYVELLSLFERADVGFNLYYTFREGESAWIYARLLRLFHQVLGVTCFSVDPYQLGHENPEAIDSGAFWFYRKLGFRPTDPAIARLTVREEERLRSRSDYRSSHRTLERLAEGFVLYEMPGAEPGAWDRFRVRRLAQRLQEKGVRIPPKRGSDAAHLHAMQQNQRLRAEWLKLGQV